MELQTRIPLEKQAINLIDYNSNILLFGSCFVENIGDKLTYFKFQNLQNPFGILFHPLAVQNLISKAIHGKKYTDENVFLHNEQWHCFDAHSKLSCSTKEELLTTLNTNLDSTSKHLRKSTHVIITLGTAWVFKHYKSNLPVANCHKVPQKSFIKELLSVDEVTDSLKLTVDYIHHTNPKTSVIFTVSPVRHIKDGFVENTQSKSHLIAGIHNLLKHYSQTENRHYFYFPSYEIMMDELRDYRFYDEDMIHPNKTAIKVIWEKFKHVWVSGDADTIMDKIAVIQKGIQHRPFNLNSEAHKKFLQQLELKKVELQKEIPRIQF